MQTTKGIGAGDRPGVLQIELADVYPDHRGGFTADRANLLGQGSNAAVRASIGTRKIEDIGLPKFISMNGSMGWGVVDCIRGMRVLPNGGAPTSHTNNRYGDDWLAARALRMHDLDGDSQAINAHNIGIGVNDEWDHIKGRSISSLGGSIGSSSW